MPRCRTLNSIKLLLILLSVLISTESHASYVSYGNTSQITSVPYTTSGFGFSDGSGNSMSFTSTTNVPIFVNQYPNAIWVQMDKANVPPNALILQYLNGYPVYYCRLWIQDQLYYGQLIRGEGCYVSDISEKPFQSYQTLVR